METEARETGPDRFVATDRRVPRPGPYYECDGCGAWKKDHGPNGECPPYTMSNGRPR
jgi:hypothetical protein